MLLTSLFTLTMFSPCLNPAAARLMASGVYGQSAGANDSGYDGDEPLGSMKEMEAQTIGDLLPDDDDLMSGIIDGFEYTGLSNQDDADEDIFYTGGGLELEHDDSNNVDKFRDVSFKIQLSEKHSIDKHHSRALIVKNINPGIEGSDLRALFQVSFFFSFSLDIDFLLVNTVLPDPNS